MSRVLVYFEGIIDWISDDTYDEGIFKLRPRTDDDWGIKDTIFRVRKDSLRSVMPGTPTNLYVGGYIFGVGELQRVTIRRRAIIKVLWYGIKPKKKIEKLDIADVINVMKADWDAIDWSKYPDKQTNALVLSTEPYASRVIEVAPLSNRQESGIIEDEGEKKEEEERHFEVIDETEEF